MQVVRSRSTYSRIKKNRKLKNVGKESPTSPVILTKLSRDQENRLRDLVEHRFMKMDEDHNRVRDQFLDRSELSK